MNRTLIALLLLAVGAGAFLLFAYGISPDLASRWAIETDSGSTGIAVPHIDWFVNGLSLFVGMLTTVIGGSLMVLPRAGR